MSISFALDTVSTFKLKHFQEKIKLKKDVICMLNILLPLRQILGRGVLLTITYSITYFFSLNRKTLIDF